MITTLIGYGAGITTAIALLPQVMKSWQTKSTQDISLSWTLIYTFSMILWVVYGILLRQVPMMATLSIELLLYVILLTLKIKHG